LASKPRFFVRAPELLESPNFEVVISTVAPALPQTDVRRLVVME
jgi:hypothetical protein